VLSTDRVVHDLYDAPSVRDAVVGRFGESVAPRGVIDRDAVARLAFADPSERAWLESLLWPRVGSEMARWRRQLELASPAPCAAVVEVPLLFEAGLQDAFDATIAVIADERLRRERAESRALQALQERSARQLSQEEKASRATHVVSNDGTVLELEQKLSAILDILKQ
jgi:dephospho-CoA kinase